MTVPLSFQRMLPLLLLAVAAGTATPARADDPPPREPPRRDWQSRLDARDARSDSVRRAEREARGGRVLGTERMQSDGRDVTRVKVLDEHGRVRAFVHDPQSRRPRQVPRPEAVEPF